MVSAKIESERYGRSFKAYSKIIHSPQAQFVLSEKSPETNRSQFQFPKPLEGRCEHNFCLQSMQEVYRRPVPLQEIKPHDLVTSFESQRLAELKLKPQQPPISVAKMRGIDRPTVTTRNSPVK